MNALEEKSPVPSTKGPVPTKGGSFNQPHCPFGEISYWAGADGAHPPRAGESPICPGGDPQHVLLLTDNFLSFPNGTEKPAVGSVGTSPDDPSNSSIEPRSDSLFRHPGDGQR